MQARLRVAIIDDDADFRESVAALLDDNGFEAVAWERGHDFLACADAADTALVLIDLKLKGELGLVVAQQVRQTLDLPIVMLTGTGDEVDKVIGLESGADDYVMKPFNPRELIARIRAVLRRYGRQKPGPRQQSARGSDAHLFSGHVLDAEARELFNPEGEPVPLTNAEYRILQYFVLNAGRIITRAEMLEALGADLSRFMDRTIDVMILRLRRKIEKVPSKPKHIQTRRGAGYIFLADEDGVQ